VEDDGIGVAEDELPLIFERFYRTDRSRSRETGGAGIGLAIVKSIVSAHGGAVFAESGPGRGTRFVVTLPKR
jgi:signal transduction histidine kinase